MKKREIEILEREALALGGGKITPAAFKIAAKHPAIVRDAAVS